MTAATTPSRKAALLKLLEDWEAGRTTILRAIKASERGPLAFHRLTAYNRWEPGGTSATLTPAGLAEARRVRDGAPHE